jgi:predicted metalloprotease with PDZ domain
MEHYRPGAKVEILVSRRDHLIRVATTFGKEPVQSWKLEFDPDATPAQVAARNAWLTGKSPQP